MDKQQLKDAFSELTRDSAWTMQLVKIKQSTKTGTSYICREIRLIPSEKLLESILAISKHYTSSAGIPSYASIDDYTGDVVGNVIYRMQKTDPLIMNEYNAFIQASGKPDIEMDVDQLKASATAFVGSLKIDGQSIPAHLISIKKPVSFLTNKYLLAENGNFKEVDQPILTIQKTIDVALLGNEVLFFSPAGEKLFNMNRSYRINCKNKVKDIINADLLADSDSFSVIANKGINPRRFVSFNSSRLSWLKVPKNRIDAALKFGFKLDQNNKILTTEEKEVELLIKFFCDKAMIDPCNESPVEVYSAKPWVK